MTQRPAQIIDFAAARRRLRDCSVHAVEDLHTSEVGVITRRLAIARKKLRAEASALPRAFAAVALAEADRVTELDSWLGAKMLDAFEQWRNYDVETGTSIRPFVTRFDRYEEEANSALAALRLAIDELNKAKREPGRKRVGARRRLLRERQRWLLLVLFRFGRWRIDHRELEWRNDFDGFTLTRRREATGGPTEERP